MCFSSKYPLPEYRYNRCFPDSTDCQPDDDEDGDPEGACGLVNRTLFAISAAPRSELSAFFSSDSPIIVTPPPFGENSTKMSTIATPWDVGFASRTNLPPFFRSCGSTTIFVPGSRVVSRTAASKVA